MIFNPLILAISALIPLVIGAVWYNPKVLGTAWMKESGVTEESMKGANMAVIFGLTYLFSFMLATAINGMVIHQNHIFSIMLNETGFGEEGSDIMKYINDFMTNYGTNFRTFKHGAFHGVLTGIFVALPILGVNALFERKSGKYIAINVGFWTVCLTLMGGIICQFS